MTTAHVLNFNTSPLHDSANEKFPTASILEQLKALDARGYQPLEIPELEREQKRIAQVYCDNEVKAEVDVVEYVTAKFQVAKAKFKNEITSAVSKGDAELDRLKMQLENMEATLKTVKQYIGGDPSNVKPMKYAMYKIVGLILLQIAVVSSTVATNATEFSLESLMSQAAAESGE